MHKLLQVLIYLFFLFLGIFFFSLQSSYPVNHINCCVGACCWRAMAEGFLQQGASSHAAPLAGTSVTSPCLPSNQLGRVLRCMWKRGSTCSPHVSFPFMSLLHVSLLSNFLIWSWHRSWLDPAWTCRGCSKGHVLKSIYYCYVKSPVEAVLFPLSLSLSQEKMSQRVMFCIKAKITSFPTC